MKMDRWLADSEGKEFEINSTWDIFLHCLDDNRECIRISGLKWNLIVLGSRSKVRATERESVKLNPLTLLSGIIKLLLRIFLTSNGLGEPLD